MRIFIFCSITLFLFSSKIKNNFKTIDVYVKSSMDSLDLPLALISIFQKGFLVKDTLTDLSGKYTLNNIEEIEGLIIRYSGHYPVYLTSAQIERSPIVYLDISEILIQTSGMGIDSVLNNMYDSLENKIYNWNHDIRR